MLQHSPSGRVRAPRMPGARWRGHKPREGRECRRGRKVERGEGRPRGARGRVPTRRPAPSWSRGRRSRPSAASSPPAPPPRPCRRSWRRPSRTWRAVRGSLSRGENGPAAAVRARLVPGILAHLFLARGLPGGIGGGLLPPPAPPLPGRRPGAGVGCRTVAGRK